MINKVQNIDCLIGMQNIPDKSIDMILCDLPYGATACKWDVIIPFAPLWNCYERIIKDNGAIVLTASQPFTSMLVMSNTELFRYEWIWEKSRPTGTMQKDYQPFKIHENILVFYKKVTTYNPLKYKVTERYIDKRKSFNAVINSNGGQLDKFNRVHSLDDGWRFPQTILSFNSMWSKEMHPTQKPVALFEYLIKTYTNEGETILDNCAGSGTTAIACINTNRNYILMEKEEKYYKIIQERIKKHTPQLKLIA